MAKKKKTEELDTETTLADMNVEGFRWYDPHKKKGKTNSIGPITRKEYWAMVRGALSAMLPFFIGLIAVFGFLFLLMTLWLK